MPENISYIAVITFSQNNEYTRVALSVGQCNELFASVPYQSLCGAVWITHVYKRADKKDKIHVLFNRTADLTIELMCVLW